MVSPSGTPSARTCHSQEASCSTWSAASVSNTRPPARCREGNPRGWPGHTASGAAPLASPTSAGRPPFRLLSVAQAVEQSIGCLGLGGPSEGTTAADPPSVTPDLCERKGALESPQ